MQATPQMFTIGAVLMVLASGQAAAAAEPVEACRADLRAAFGLTERNYAGYGDKKARLGAGVLERASAEALAELDRPEPRPCSEILRGWLAVFADRHVGLAEKGRGPVATSKEAAVSTADLPDESPLFEILSEEAARIHVRSFELQHREALERLVVAHRDEIVARPALVIDLRGNGGGSDASYEVLEEFVYSKPVRRIGIDALATAENTAAWESLIASVPLPDDKRAELQVHISAMKARPGEWVDMAADTFLTRDRVLATPARVALITDRGCMSACEQFVLESRQSDKVRVFGEPTGGVLDYSNMIPHPLPSGRTLWLASTRSRRLPAEPVDGVGIAPQLARDPRSFEGDGRSAAFAQLLLDLRAATSATR